MNDLLIQRLKSKTYWAALIMSALTIIEANTGLLAGLLPASLRPYSSLIFPMVMMVMREFTTTALADK